MNETNEQFNIEGKNKKSPIFYLVIFILVMFVVGVFAVVFITSDMDNDTENVSPVSTSSNGESRNIDKQKIREDLAKPSKFTPTEEEKQKIREDLAKPSNFTLTEEEKQAIRESLAQ